MRATPFLGLVSLVLASACGDGGPAGRFESAGGARGSYPPAVDGGAEDDDDGRAVEEADIFRFAGERLYVLNQYRGLFVFDVSDPDHPVELGRVRLAGHPVEMYVRDDVVHAVVSDYFDYWAEPVLEAGLEPVYGSRIVSIDVADPAAPVVRGEVVLDGWVTSTRLVGDILYAAANRYGPWQPGVPAGEVTDEVSVTSIDISTGAPVGVDRLDLPDTAGWITASPDAFVIAANRWDGATGVETEITWIDISSPAGELRLRGVRRLPGELREDTALHLWQGQLRVLTRAWSTATTHLYILDGGCPDTLPTIGTLDYVYDGSLFGTTFDGDRLYMVHYQRIDPLEVVDLSDPAHPFVAGILEMPGWVERIAAHGDRLVGLGVDDTDGWRISLSLFDVADPYAPVLLHRITSGTDWSWSTALWDRKAWLVDAEEGLILFPYSGWSDGATVYRHALGIVELGRDTLTPRGEVQAPAPVERGALYRDRVYAISMAAVQVVDVRDREHPVATATVELARNVLAYRRGVDAGVELVQSGLDYWYGAYAESSLRTSPLGAPDGPVELGRLPLPRAASGLILDGHTAITVSGADRCGPVDDRWPGACSPAERAGVVVADLSNPMAPAVIASLDLPAPDPLPAELSDRAWQYTWWLTSYAGEPALALGDGQWGWVRVTTITCTDALACVTLGIEPEYVDDGGWAWGWRSHNALVVLDTQAADRPRFLPEVELLDGSVDGALARGGVAAVTISQPSRVDAEGRTWVRSYVERYSVAGGRRTPVNVPGTVAWLDTGGSRALTVDRQYVDRDAWWGPAIDLWLVAIELGEEDATVTSRLHLGEELASVSAGDDWVYAVHSDLGDGVVVGTDEWTAPDTVLLAIDVRDRDDLRVASVQPLGAGWWQLAARTATFLALAGGPDAGLALFNHAHHASAPAFVDYVRTLGWTTSIAEDGGALFIVGGPYGIQVVPIPAEP